jgi:hypothetical protein
MSNTQSVVQERLRHLLVSIAVAGLLIGLPASAARAAEAITDETVDAAVLAAKTPENHSALAAYFTSKAEAAVAAAERHAKMGKAHPFTGKAHNEAWGRHCKSLINAYRQQAKDYLALAKEQQELARGSNTPKGPKGM